LRWEEQKIVDENITNQQVSAILAAAKFCQIMLPSLKTAFNVMSATKSNPGAKMLAFG